MTVLWIDDGSENARDLVRENQTLRRQLKLVSLGAVLLPSLLVLLQVLDWGGGSNVFLGGSVVSIGPERQLTQAGFSTATKTASVVERRTQQEQQKPATVGDSVLEPMCHCSSNDDSKKDEGTNTNSSATPLRDVYVPAEQLNQLTSVRPFGWTVLVIIWASSFACLVWVFFNRTTRVVKAAQPIFLDLIVVGTIVMSSSIIPMSIDDSVASQRGCDIACMSVPWLSASGFTLIFSALFSKIWRLNRIMEGAERFQKVELSIKDVILPLIILMCLNMVFLLVWTVVDPLRFERVATGQTISGEMSSYGTCIAKGKTSIAMLSLILIVNAAAVILANIQAYQTRKWGTDFSESKWVGLCIVSILQALLIGAPLIVLAGSNPTGSFVVRSMLVFVICMSVLGLLFVPKVRNKGKPAGPIRSSQMNSSFTNQHLRLHSGAFSAPDAARSVDQEQNNTNGVVSGVSCKCKDKNPAGVTKMPRKIMVSPMVDSYISDEEFANEEVEEEEWGGAMDLDIGDGSLTEIVKESTTVGDPRRISDATQNHEEFASEELEKGGGVADLDTINKSLNEIVEESETVGDPPRISEATQDHHEFAHEEVVEGVVEGRIPGA